MWTCNCENKILQGKYHKTTVNKEGLCDKCKHYAFWDSSEARYGKDIAVTLYDKEKGTFKYYKRLRDTPLKQLGCIVDNLVTKGKKYMTANNYIVIKGRQTKITSAITQRLPKIVYVYDTECNKIGTYDTIKQASQVLGDSEGVIRNNILGLTINTKSGYIYTRNAEFKPENYLKIKSNVKEFTFNDESDFEYDEFDDLEELGIVTGEML